MTLSSALRSLALAVPLLGAVGCDDKKASSEAAHRDGGNGADKYASADPKLERALKAAAEPSSEASSGPPVTGIFEASAADQRHPKGTPTKVDMMSQGAEPMMSLGPSADAGADLARTSSYGPGIMELAIELGPRVAMPTVDLLLVLGPARKDDGGVNWLVAGVARANPAKQQVAQLPPGLDRDIASLQGSLIRLEVTPDGRESDLVTELSKAAKPELARMVQTGAEALVFATVPLPPRPVGVGAQWIAETRMPFSGIDALAYRAYQVKSIDGDRVHLTLQVKVYAASHEANVEGVPKGATFEQFEAEAQGELELVRGESLARKSEVQQRVVMVFAGPGGAQPPQQPGQPPGNMLTAQLSSQTTFVRGEDLRAAMKQP
jgi:hypothetical protein